MYFQTRNKKKLGLWHRATTVLTTAAVQARLLRFFFLEFGLDDSLTHSLSLSLSLSHTHTHTNRRQHGKENTTEKKNSKNKIQSNQDDYDDFLGWQNHDKRGEEWGRGREKMMMMMTYRNDSIAKGRWKTSDQLKEIGRPTPNSLIGRLLTSVRSFFTLLALSLSSFSFFFSNNSWRKKNKRRSMRGEGVKENEAISLGTCLKYFV